MQEYNLPMVKTLQRGLRNRSDSRRDKDLLTQCKGMRPTENGLRSCVEVKNPFAAVPVIDWPFPQLLRSQAETLLAFDDEIFSVSEADGWSLSALNTYDLHEPSKAKDITLGSSWHMAELPKGWILANGESTIFKLGDQPAYVQDEIQINSCCHFRGRVIYGGFSPANFFSAGWRSLWSRWTENFPYEIDASFDDDTRNWVYWTTIGGGDVLLPFAPELTSAGLLKEDIPSASDEAFYLELFKRNELGFMPMPWQGSVYIVKELGKGVVVYGENGIAALVPVSEPYPTFGLLLLSHEGVAGRNAVGGDWRRHVFADRAGVLWSLDANYNLRKLDYSEYINQLVGELAFSYDAEEDEHYISGSNACFVLTPTGMGESPQVVTSCQRVGESLFGVSQIKSAEAIGVTDTIDFNYRDYKTLTGIEIGKTGAKMWVAADCDYGAGFKRSSFVPINSAGFARLQKTALNFRLVFKAESYEDLAIDYINIRWQVSGKRTIRGMYASTTGSEPDNGSLG